MCNTSLGHSLNNPQYSEREHFIDLLKGGGIVAVILQHSLGGTGYYEHLSDFLLSFHMPLFFLCSGYVYRHSINVLEKRVFSLLVPSVIWRCMNFLISFILSCLSLESYAGKLRFGGFWFLNALFSIHIIHFLLHESVLNSIQRKMRVLFLLAILVTSQILAWGGIFEKLEKEDFLCQALVGYAFFLLGVFFKEFRLFERIKDTLSVRIIEVVVALASFALLWRTCCLNRSVWMYINIYGIPCKFYFNAVLGCLGALLLAHAIGKHLVFEFLGRYSLLILLQHFFLLCLFPWFWNRLAVPQIAYPWLSTPLICGVTAISSFLIQRHFPLLSGKQPRFITQNLITQNQL